MTDMELAEEIERKLGNMAEDFRWAITFSSSKWQQIVAALRRGPDLRQKMRDIFKQYGVGDGSPGWIEHTDQDGKLRRDKMSFEGELIFGIEALLERPPSGEMAFVLKAARELSAFIKYHSYPEIGSADFVELTRLADVQDTELRALSAVEAEGHK